MTCPIPFETLALYGGEQTLWPDHCVQGTAGAQFSPASRRSNMATAARRNCFN